MRLLENGPPTIPDRSPYEDSHFLSVDRCPVIYQYCRTTVTLSVGFVLRYHPGIPVRNGQVEMVSKKFEAYLYVL